MEAQTPLFRKTRYEVMESAFWRFDRENPHVWDLFRRFVSEARHAGHRHYSADAILHRIRWHTSVETKSSDGLKINNNWAAFYARKWQRMYPRQADFFRTREQVSEGRECAD